jgi:hypothetical protein
MDWGECSEEVSICGGELKFDIYSFGSIRCMQLTTLEQKLTVYTLALDQVGIMLTVEEVVSVSADNSLNITGHISACMGLNESQDPTLH